MGIETTGQIIINSKNSNATKYISNLSKIINNNKNLTLDLLPAEEQDLPFITGFCDGEFGPSFEFYGRQWCEQIGLDNLISKLTELDPNVRLLITRNYDCDSEWTYVNVYSGSECVYFGSECVEDHKVVTDPIYSGLDKFFN